MLLNQHESGSMWSISCSDEASQNLMYSLWNKTAVEWGRNINVVLIHVHFNSLVAGNHETRLNNLWEMVMAVSANIWYAATLHFTIFYFLFCQRAAYDLIRFGHRNNRSVLAKDHVLALWYLLWSTESQLEMSWDFLKNIQWFHAYELINICFWRSS